MKIALDGSRAFLRRRTGIEEYSYQVIRHLRGFLREESVTLYIRADQLVDFDLPKNWRVKKLWAPRLWTQVRLSWEMFLHKSDVLFVPAHTVPVVHPKRTVVVVHGLEYEFCPEAYSLWERLYMRRSIRYSVRSASNVVCVSENTRRDAARLYGVPAEKMTVVYEGYDDTIGKDQNSKTGILKNQSPSPKRPFFLFIGRIEERKNINRIVEAFEIVKKEYCLSHRLVLAGRPGYGYEGIRARIERSEYRDDIEEIGYVDEKEKWRLLAEADIFIFPTLYEGFGIPLLEAQSVGTPVIAADNSSIPEVAGSSAVLVDPYDVRAIVWAMRGIMSNEGLRNDIIQKGRENVGRFGWNRCARDIADILKYGKESRNDDRFTVSSGSNRA